MAKIGDFGPLTGLQNCGIGDKLRNMATLTKIQFRKLSLKMSKILSRDDF